MGRRKSPSQKPAAGVMLLVASLLLALSFLPRAAGLPVVLGRWQQTLLGNAALLLPVCLTFAGLYLLIAGAQARFSRRLAALLVLLLAGLAAYHAWMLPSRGAGFVGGALVWALRTTLGEIGMWLLLTMSGAAAVALASGRSLAELRDVIERSISSSTHVVARGAASLWSVLAAGAGRARSAAAALGAGFMRLTRRATPEPEPTPPATPPISPPMAPVTSEERQSAQGAWTNIAQAPRPPLEPARTGHRQQLLELEAPSGGYQLPPISLLTDLPAMRGRGKSDPAEVAKALEQTLASFGVEASVLRWEQGPVVTRFEVQPAPGVRVQKISSLTNDIALALAAPSVRIEAPIPGKSAVGIELPNQKTSLVHIKEIITSDEYQRATTPLTVAIGKDIAGHAILADLAEMPHLLIAGATGSGKSVMLNAIIAGLLFRCTPLEVRLLMIDPKRVEFTNYNNVPHLLVPVVTNPRSAAGALKQMLQEMEERFERFSQSGVRNIQAYNQLSDVERLPFIVIIIDELADLMMVAPADFEDVICRLAQMTRATGIHMVLATQRPSVDVITGLIKANIPSRIAFAVSSQVDSRTILDMPGAEKLLGKGDMLFMPIAAPRPVRAQGAFIADSEVQTLVAWWKSQGKPAFDQKLMHAEKSSAEGDGGDDELLIEAARLIVRSGYGSVSLLQRKMKIGYVRAARIVDQLEEKGIVGPTQGSNPREVLMGIEELDRLLGARAKTE